MDALLTTIWFILNVTNYFATTCIKLGAKLLSMFKMSIITGSYKWQIPATEQPVRTDVKPGQDNNNACTS